MTTSFTDVSAVGGGSVAAVAATTGAGAGGAGCGETGCGGVTATVTTGGGDVDGGRLGSSTATTGDFGMLGWGRAGVGGMAAGFSEEIALGGAAEGAAACVVALAAGEPPKSIQVIAPRSGTSAASASHGKLKRGGDGRWKSGVGMLSLTGAWRRVLLVCSTGGPTGTSSWTQSSAKSETKPALVTSCAASGSDWASGSSTLSISVLAAVRRWESCSVKSCGVGTALPLSTLWRHSCR